MGVIEIRDQVRGLWKAAETVNFIDCSKVGIMGWSYGGYLSLMAIAQYPDLFKVKTLSVCIKLVLSLQSFLY